MGPRSRLTVSLPHAASLLAAASALAACCPPGVDGPAGAVRPVPSPTPAVTQPVVPVQVPEPARPLTMADKVVADFEAAVKTSQDAYLALFDFKVVGEMEILLHRYDLLGRLPNLSDDVRGQFAAEDGTPYPAERERTNVGGFYGILAQRTVGTGGCKAVPPRTRYARELGTYEPLPAGTPEAYEKLRASANAMIAKGGVTSLRCKGGRGGIALVWTERPNERGYDLITIYDD